MADPPIYSRQFSFSDHSTNYPTLPQPGVWIDAEYNAIKVSLDAVRQRQVDHLLRSDDMLRNGIVHRDSLAADVLDALSTSETNAAASASAAQASAESADSSAQAAAQYGGVNTTSTTQQTIGVGSKAFTVVHDRPFQVGQFVIATDQANIVNYMHGQVSAWDSGSKLLTVDVAKTGGGGTISAWSITNSAPAGEDGTAAGALLAVNDLSDLNSVPTAQTNLGLGALAVQSTVTIGQVDGLQAELDGKAAVSHGHPISEVTGLQAELDGKAPTAHGHAIGDVAGLQSALDSKVTDATSDGKRYVRRNGVWVAADRDWVSDTPWSVGSFVDVVLSTEDDSTQLLQLIDLSPTTAVDLRMSFYDSGGQLASLANYGFVGWIGPATNAVTGRGAGTATLVDLSSSSVGEQPAESLFGRIELENTQDTFEMCQFWVSVFYKDLNGRAVSISGPGVVATTVRIVKVRFEWNGANADSAGKIVLRKVQALRS